MLTKLEAWFQAAKSGDLSVIKNMLRDKEISISQPRPKNGLTALHYAEINGDTALAHFLVENKTDINQKDDDGYTALDYLIRRNTVDEVEWLLNHGADATSSMRGLSENAHINTKEFIKIAHLLIQHGADPKDYKNKQNITLLHIAAQQGDNIFAHYLLSFPSTDINAKNIYGLTPILVAAANRHWDTVQNLMSTGTDINAQGNHGGNLFSYIVHGTDSIGHDSPEERRMYDFLRMGAKLTHAKAKLTPLITAIIEEKWQVADHLLEEFRSLNDIDAGREPAIIHAARANKIDLVRKLIASSANIYVLSKDGKCLFELLEINGRSEDELKALAQFSVNLISKRLDMAITPPNLCFNALMQTDSLVALRWLLKYYKNANVKYNNLSLLQTAAQYSTDEIIKCVVEAGANVHEKTETGKSIADLISCNSLIEDPKSLIQYINSFGAALNDCKSAFYNSQRNEAHAQVSLQTNHHLQSKFAHLSC